MKLVKCDICGDINTKDADKDFFEISHDNQTYDLCNTCLIKYRELKHDLTSAFIFYPNRKIEIKISKEEEVRKNE